MDRFKYELHAVVNCIHINYSLIHKVLKTNLIPKFDTIELVCTLEQLGSEGRRDELRVFAQLRDHFCNKDKESQTDNNPFTDEFVSTTR